VCFLLRKGLVNYYFNRKLRLAPLPSTSPYMMYIV
jgi:hypothetical protein